MQPPEPVDVLFSTLEGGYAVARWSGPSGQSVAFYDVGSDESALPVEVRVWRSSTPITQQRLDELLAHWVTDGQPESFDFGISTDDIRAVPVGTLHRLMHNYVADLTHGAGEILNVPTESEIEAIIESGLRPARWRNARDFRAHARQLRGVSAYVEAVYDYDESHPMSQVADETGVDLPTARKLIQQAREQGYLTKGNGHVGGRVTERAVEAAKVMRDALEELEILRVDVKDFRTTI